MFKLINPAEMVDDIVPAVDAIHNIGSPLKRWAAVYVGTGSVFIEDTVTHLDAELTVTNGVLFVDGVAAIQIGDITLTDQGITFSDGTDQTSGVQSGVAVCTGPSSSVTFESPYATERAPQIVATQIGSTPNGLSACISVTGTNGAWTGFTLHLSSSFFGAYAWLAQG
jgi:hypothetical protein